MHLLGSLAAHDRVSVVHVQESGRYRVRLGSLTVHMAYEQARDLTNELMATVPAPDWWPDEPEPEPQRFIDQHPVAVAAVAPGDWVLRDDGDDWGQVVARVRGVGASTFFSFHDGAKITWPNKALVTIGKPADPCGGGDLPSLSTDFGCSLEITHKGAPEVGEVRAVGRGRMSADPRGDWLVVVVGLTILIACIVVVLAVMPGAVR